MSHLSNNSSDAEGSSASKDPQSDNYDENVSSATPEETSEMLTSDLDPLASMAVDESFSGDEDESESEGIAEETSDETTESQSEPKAHTEKGSAKGDKEKNVDHKKRYDAFLAELSTLEDNDRKISHIIAFMEKTLSTDKGVPFFKNFWEARTLALQYFKENITPALRTDLWQKYADLSKEARRLKEMLDEQSAYAAEQIEIAVSALEQEQQSSAEQLASIELPEGIVNTPALAHARNFYLQAQQELNFLNAHSGRITGLRKELIRTDMRVRQKNQFFRRLSQLGDCVFPRRKELIKSLSQQFMADIDTFMQKHFNENAAISQPFALREEIKALQSTAKTLTLNTQAFSHSRTKLSEAWEKLKVIDKERKKERAEQKTVFKQNADVLLQKVHALKEAVDAGETTASQLSQQIYALNSEIRHAELGRDEVRAVVDALRAVQKVVDDQQKAEEQIRQQRLEEKERQKQEQINQVKEHIEKLQSAVADYDIAAWEAARNEVTQQVAALILTRNEKQEFERLLKPLKDLLADKHEQALMSLPASDREAIQQLKAFLKERLCERQAIKDQLEVYRKMKSASSLDFEKAMEFNAQITADKERLEKVSLGIQELENKLKELEGRS